MTKSTNTSTNFVPHLGLITVQFSAIFWPAHSSAHALIRKLIAGTPLRPRPPDQYAALLRELSAIGNNVNQIAYWANAQKSIREAEIVDAAVLARRAWELVKNGL